MNTNADLAGWGEPPATPDDEALASLLNQWLAEIEGGRAVDPAALRGNRPELARLGIELVHTLSLLQECAAGVRESSPAPPAAAPPGAGGHLPDPFPGEYRVVQVLGEGAFGRVLLADDLNLGCQVALKTLKLPAESTMGPQVLAALRTEARHLAQMNHPNIVRVHAWREAQGEYYLVLQFVAGGSLADRLRAETALGWPDATRYVCDVGEALVEAHKRGVIHRDIKPDNILWDADRDEAMLTDFGVSARLAEPGTAAGTPVYMAPEAFEGGISPALDVYSLAATFYRLATGKLPFAKGPVYNLVFQKIQGLPDPDPNCRGIPEAVERAIRAGLAAKPAERPSMADFVATLRGTLNQLLADDLAPSEPKEAGLVNLRLVVSRQAGAGVYLPVAATQPQPGSQSRDMKKVPPAPDRVGLRTGDRVRVEVVADRSGSVTVFNVGPTGNLNLLYPDDAGGACPIEAHRPLHVLDVEMTPPTGRERLFAVWSRTPLQADLRELVSLAEVRPGPCSVPYHATRDMKRVRQAVTTLPPGEWRVVVMELDHH